MRINQPGFTILTLVILAMLSAPVFAEESQAERIHKQSRGYSSDWNLGELQFSDEIPSLDELTEDELELLEGEWLPDVLQMLSTSAIMSGGPPERISLSMLRALHDTNYGMVEFGIEPDERGRNWSRFHYTEKYICPLTGKYPRLNSEEYSKGNFYMFLLSPEEQNHIINKLVHAGRMPGDLLEHYLVTSAYYYRFYGEQGVLAQGILWYPGYDMFGNSIWEQYEMQKKDTNSQ